MDEDASYLGFDLVDRRTLFAKLEPQLVARDEEWLHANLEGMQWTEINLLPAIKSFARECGYMVMTKTEPNISLPNS